MYFLIKDNELLEKCNKTWVKVGSTIKKGFDSEPVYNEKYLKTKIKSYKGKVNTNFHNDKIGSHCMCQSVVLISFAFKMSKRSDKVYY